MPSHPWLLCLAAIVYAAVVTVLMLCTLGMVTIWKLIHAAEVPYPLLTTWAARERKQPSHSDIR